MTLFSSLLVLAILVIAQVILRYFQSKSPKLTNCWYNSDRVYRRTFLLLAFLGLIFALYQSSQQYWVWSRAGPPSVYLLPPYQPIVYFLKYALTNFFLKPAIVFAASLLFLFGAKALNRRFQQRFFEKDEPYLGAISLVLLGHPLWIFYLPLVLVSGLFLSVFLRFFTKKIQRLPLYWLWFPVAILILFYKTLFV